MTDLVTVGLDAADWSLAPVRDDDRIVGYRLTARVDGAVKVIADTQLRGFAEWLLAQLEYARDCDDHPTRLDAGKAADNRAPQRTVRQVGWLGHTGRVYDLDTDPSPSEPGGFMPLYIERGD